MHENTPVYPKDVASNSVYYILRLIINPDVYAIVMHDLVDPIWDTVSPTITEISRNTNISLINYA